MRRQYHGGQNARDWRRKVAALARKRKESVFTYKFKLDVRDGDMDFDAAARTYDVTEGIERGSLIGLVCAVHLSGFRLFFKEAETRRFMNRSRYPETVFAEALHAHTEITNAAVTVKSIENLFTTPPRRSGGVVRPWSADELARRLFQAWNNRSPRETEKDRPELSLARGIASEVTAKFSGWKDLADDVAGALACADEYITTLGDSFPKLGKLPPATAGTDSSGTLVYDPESPFVDMAGNKEIWLHQVVAVCAGRLQRDMPGLDPTSSKFAGRLNGEVVTSQNYGLSWLFGKGLRSLRNSSIEHLVEDLAVPHTERRRVKQLKVFADAIPVNPIFKTDGYAEFRGSVGGKIASWVSNYWKRIRELTALHAQPPNVSIPERLADSENASLFSGQHTDVAGLVALSNRVPERVQEAGAALAVLRGGNIPGSQEIETIEAVASELTELRGQFAMLDNRLEQEKESAEDEVRANRLESLHRELSKELNKLPKLPKLNRISGGTDDARGEIQRLETCLNGAMQGRRKHFRRLTEWVGNAALDPFPALEERERKALSDRKMDSDLAAEYALRRLLHHIAAMSRRLSPRASGQVRETMMPVFLDKTHANRYFHNRRGALYRPPLSTSRHQAYKIDVNRARATDWLAWLEARAAEIREELRRVPNVDHARFRDLLLIEEFVFTTRLGGLPDSVPGHLAKPDADTVGIPPLLAAQLDAETVPRDVAVRAFNLFNSAINGLTFRAFRDSFIVRTKFQRLDHEELCYVPKDRPWQPPVDYSSAKGEIAEGLALPAVVRDDQTGAVLPKKTAEGLSKANFPEPGSRALLRQAPHDWFVELDLRQGPVPELAGLPVKKNAATLKRWKVLKRPAFRLIGPPSFKTWLDRTLTDTVRDKDVKLGDYTLLLDRVFTQSVKVEGEDVRLSAEPVKIRAELAVPVVDKRPYPKHEDDFLFDNVVAIDLGERRIGYAIFSLTKFVESGCQDPFEVGNVAIPTFRKLQAAVRRHRGSRQPNQKVGQTYSKALMQFRENIVGDVCNRIETLCERFRGFPILESSVSNFEAGGRQLEMIYGSVLRRYVYSEMDAHKTLRRQHWFTADTWDHPYVHTHTWNTKEKQYSGSSKPLYLFPGIKVNPAGTSQTCHRCGRNALQALRNMPDKVPVGENGLIALKNGTIRLLDRADYPPCELKKFCRRKERPPLNTPVAKGTQPRQRIESIAKRNMRRAPLSEMSPDTMQARFTCVYVDCGFEGHADENAAVNIGRRFFERIDSEKSRRDLTGRRE